MQRLYFLTPDLDTTVNIAHELSELGLTRRQVHVTGRDWRHLAEQGINNATLRQTTDVVHAAVRGLAYGAPLGLVLGILVYWIAGEALGVGPLALSVGLGIGGGLFGAWVSTMIGVSVHDVKVDKYERDLEKGAFLMMVDVTDRREAAIHAIIHRHHPEVTIDKVTAWERRHHYGTGA